MNVRDLYRTLRRVRFAINFREEMNNQSPIWEAIEEYTLKQKYTPGDYQVDVDALLAFNETGQDLYDRKYLGLRMHESICAVAVGLSEDFEYIINSIKLQSNEEFTEFR